MENFLTPLFKSKLRRRLLGLFFTNVKQRYYVRQLQGMLEVSVGTLHRELERLEGIGILSSEKMGNQRHFFANPNYPLFNELRNIIRKTIGLEGTLKEALRGVKGIEVAFIFGSFATGEEAIKSDIDLFLIGRYNENLLNKKLQEVEQLLSREVNYTSMTIEEFKREKKRKDPFLQKVLKGNKIFLVGDDDGLRQLA